MKKVVGKNHPAFVGKTGNGVVIATIDSGVANGHPHVGFVSGGVSIEADGTSSGDFADRLGHGTAVAAVIREKAPEASLLAIRVFHHQLRTSVESLVRGIDWAAEHGAHLINLSLGTSDPTHEDLLAGAVSRASAQGALLVSAYQHEDQLWLPGALPKVLPVVLDRSCDRSEIVIGSANGTKLIGASGLPRPIPGVPVERNLQGISFAVANVTGLIARLVEGSGPSLSLSDVFAQTFPEAL